MESFKKITDKVRGKDTTSEPPKSCGACGMLHPPDNAFCEGCGKPLTSAISAPPKALVLCPHCGEANPPDNQFCQACGKRIDAEPPLKKASPNKPLHTISCPHCGMESDEDGLFCEQCGGRLKDAPLRIPSETACEDWPASKPSGKLVISSTLVTGEADPHHTKRENPYMRQASLD